MPWWKRAKTARNQTLSLSSPLGWEVFRLGGPNYADVTVNEGTALGLSAVYRAVSLISGVLASLPLRTLRDTGDGMRQRTASIFDNPGGLDGPTQFEWVETAMCHLLLHGNAYAFKVHNTGGAVVRLVWFHPLLVGVELPTREELHTGTGPVGGKWFRCTLDDGTSVRYDATDILHIPALTTDGVKGLSPIAVARNSLGTSIAADRSAGKAFASGMTATAVATPTDDDLEPDDVNEAKRQLRESVTGWENAGGLAVISRKLTITPLTINPKDAQFLESRQFQIEEIARWFGVPPHALMQTEKQTSWGTGVKEQNLGLGRTTLSPWANRFEQRLSRILPAPRFVEFDFAGLERPDPETEIRLLMEQVDKGFMTLNEARAVRNLPPVPGGDVIRGAQPQEQETDNEPQPA